MPDALSPELVRPELEAHHPSQSTAKIENNLNFISVFKVHFCGAVLRYFVAIRIVDLKCTVLVSVDTTCVNDDCV